MGASEGEEKEEEKITRIAKRLKVYEKYYVYNELFFFPQWTPNCGSMNFK